MNIRKIANSLLNFAIKKLAEILGILIFLAGLMLFLSLATYSPSDPNFIFQEKTEIKNLLGFQGSFVSDLFFQSVGLIAYLISATLIMTGINIVKTKEFSLLIENLFFAILYSIFGTFFLNHFYSEGFSIFLNGNGGFVGAYLNTTFLQSIISINNDISYYILIVLCLISFLFSVNFNPYKFLIFITKIFNFFNK